MVLRQVSAILREELRGTDTLCRIGGEEFLIIFPGQATPEAMICAERCRHAIESHSFRAAGMDLKVTVSTGIACRTTAITHHMDLLKAADQALYLAKSSGRNRICTNEQVPAEKQQTTTMDMNLSAAA